MGNNPVSNVDPLGDTYSESGPGWLSFSDIFAGVIYGAVDNVFGTNLRETYRPIDPKAYNSSLRATDAAMAAGGAAMVVQGTTTMEAGVVALAAGPEAGVPVIVAGAAEAAVGYAMASNAAKNIAKGYNYGEGDQTNNTNQGTPPASPPEKTPTPSKVEKTKTETKVGDKFTKTTEVRPSKQSPGQSRAEYVKYKNRDGKTIKMYKDSYDRANKFQHRKIKLPTPIFHPMPKG